MYTTRDVTGLNRWLSLALAGLLLAFNLLGCATTTEPEAIRIGVLAIQSGEEMNIKLSGHPTIDGVELALQQMEEAGRLQVDGRDVEIDLVIVDEGDSPETAVAAAKRLINQENVVALVGPQFSSKAIPVAQVAEQAGIPMISPMSTNPETTTGKRYIFRVGFIDSFQGQVVAQFALEELQAETAAILYNVSNAYSRDMAEIFSEVFLAAGGEIVAMEPYTTDKPEFEEALERIAAEEPDVLFLPNYTTALNVQVPMAREKGITAHLLGADTWNSIEIAEDSPFIGAFYSTHWHAASDNPVSRDFVEAYRAAYPEKELRITAALTYDALMMILEAIREQNSVEPNAIRQGLANLDDYEGVSGTIGYQGTGDPIKSAVIMQIQEDGPIFYKLINP